MNRLNKTRLHQTPERWNYVPTSQNPADFCTRFVLLSNLNFHQSWLNGPTLLEQQLNSISVDNDSDELFEIEEKLTNNLVQTKVEYQSFIKSDHYSSLKKLVLQIACLLEFKQLWLIKKRKLLAKKFPTKLQLKILNMLSSKYSKKPNQNVSKMNLEL